MNEPQQTIIFSGETTANGGQGEGIASTDPTARVPVTPETVASIRRPADANISPDGKRAAFVVWEYVADAPKQRGRIWIAETAGGDPRPLTRGPYADTCPRWSPDSAQIAFISRGDGEGSKVKPQLYLIPAQGGEAKQVCTMPNGVSDLSWAPDGSRIAFLSLEGEEPKTDPRVIRPGRFQRLWTVRPDYDTPEPVTPDEFTIWEYAWSADSRQIAVYYTTGPDETDWYQGQIGVVAASGGTIRQVSHLTRQASALAWAPDGTRIAYVSGEWSDRGLVGGDIFVLPLDGGEPRNLTPGVEFSPSWCQWFPNGRKLLYACWNSLTHQIGILDESSGITTLLAKDFAIGEPPQPRLSATLDMQRLVVTHFTQQHPPDVWFGELSEGGEKNVTWRRLTGLNPLAEETLALSPSERISYESVDGWRIDALFTPPLKKENTPPPLVVHVHGGPTWAYTDGFSLFDQVLNSAGYAELRPNIRGSIGRGAAFSDAVLGDMGGNDFQDVLRGVDYLVERGLVDGNRVAIMGGSYGGFMSAWAVSQTNRFKAAVMNAGVSDFHSFHAQSNIPDWDVRIIGVSPLEQPDLYRQHSAITYAARVTTPTLIIHGEQDESVPVNQAYAFYRALRERSVPVELVIYPREGHSTREREHVLDLGRRILRWFEQYLK